MSGSGGAQNSSGNAVDISVIEQLHDDVGREAEITRDVLRSYASRAPELAVALERAVVSTDTDAIRQSAHDLRSISAFVGARSMVVLAAELETGDWSLDRVTELSRAVTHRLPAVLDELGRFADSL